MADEPSFLTLSTSDQVAREAEIMVLRSMSRTLDAMSAEMVAHRKDISDIKTDIAVMAERQSTNADLRQKIDTLHEEVDKIKARGFQQDGAVTFATMLKDFGPWLVSLGLLYWSLFGK